MKYLYIQKTRIGFRIMRDLDNGSREGLHYIGYSRRDAIRAFRRDFDCVGKHFTIIET